MIAVALALIGALLFALSATLTKLVTAQLAHVGIVGTAGYWPAYALAAVALTGLVLEQAAFSSGSFPAAMAAITITDPLLSYGFSVAGFGEPLPWGSDLGFSVAASRRPAKIPPIASGVLGGACQVNGRRPR